jgi:excisionase family DNA binding protein
MKSQESTNGDLLSQLLITRKDAARLLSVNLRTIDTWLANGRLPHIKKSRKVVRIRTKDLIAFIEG